MISTIGLQATLDGIIKHLNPFSSLIGCHMVNYITDNHWKTFIPLSVQNEIRTEENIAEALDVYWNSDSVSQEELSKFHNFVQFIEESRKFSYDSLHHTWIDTEQFRDVLSDIGCSVDSVGCLKIKEFMSPKKNHEVSVLLVRRSAGSMNDFLSLAKARTRNSFLQVLEIEEEYASQFNFLVT